MAARADGAPPCTPRYWDSNREEVKQIEKAAYMLRLFEDKTNLLTVKFFKVLNSAETYRCQWVFHFDDNGYELIESDDAYLTLGKPMIKKCVKDILEWAIQKRFN